MLLKVNSQTLHDEHSEILLFLDYIWAFFEVRQPINRASFSHSNLIVI